MLVNTVTDDHVTGVLLADLATETLHRLQATEPDTATRRQLGDAITHADDRMSFTVPHTDFALVERDGSRPAQFEGGKNDGPR